MTFIKSISLETSKNNPFPFNIPAVKFARHISLDQEVTIFAGGMQAVDFHETEHYRITKRFLDNPESYLRHLR